MTEPQNIPPRDKITTMTSEVAAKGGTDAPWGMPYVLGISIFAVIVAMATAWKLI